MPTFQDRERAFEAKFAHDEEFRFLVAARRDKLFAHWAAASVKLAQPEEDALVAAVLHISNTRGHDEAVLKHIAGFMVAHGGSKANLPEALANCEREARRQSIDQPTQQSDVL
jgi:hypothetical protein